MKIDYVGDKKFDIRYAKPHIILDEYGEVCTVHVIHVVSTLTEVTKQLNTNTQGIN